MMSAPCPILGFVVRVIPSSPDVSALLADLRALLDANGLATDAPPDAREIPIYREGSQATHADRQIIREWAEPWAGDVEISDLVDLNRGA
jgi:hypothetical protein